MAHIKNSASITPPYSRSIFSYYTPHKPRHKYYVSFLSLPYVLHASLILSSLNRSR